jgi:outer membrane receptor for ferrienterochelin and colicins
LIQIRISYIRILVIAAGLWLGLAPVASAQDGAATSAVRGRVVEKANRAPVAGATVVLIGTSFAALTEADGSYVIDGVPPGSYQVQVASYQGASANIELRPGQTAAIDLAVEVSDFAGEVVVVTGTRSPEKLFDAPLTVESISEEDMKRSGGTSYLSALAGVKGIDFADAGIGEQRISARGFTTQFNSRMLSMLDGRMAQIPGNGLPQGNFLPTSQLDMKAIEVVIGPASALYGPNAHTGVINVITKTPWDESGAAMAVRGGTQSLMDGAIRLAGTAADDFGWKLNAQYMRAEDFTPDRDATTHYYGTSQFEGDLVHDYKVESLKADASVYYRFDDWYAKASYGFSENDGFSLTNAGRNHIRDWRIQYQNAQLSHPNWYAQVTRTTSNAGGTYQLNRLAAIAEMRAMNAEPVTPEALDPIRDDIRFIDKSQMIDSEVQHREIFFGVSTAIGAQWRLYMPSSEGSYLADAGGEDISAMEVGGYIQLDKSVLDDRLRLVGAVRFDDHTNYSGQVSPKASLVYALAPRHKVRLAYNRAFKSPTILENYLLISNILLGNRNGFTIRDGAGNVLAEIDGLEPEQVNAVEVGYKGAIGRLLFIDAVAYQSWYQNFISPLTQVANPANGTFGYHADGTLVAAGTPVEGTLFTYSNFGQAKVRGADIGLDIYPLDHVTLSTSASVIELVDFKSDDELQNDLLLNVSTLKLKGGITVQNLGFDDYFVRLDGRFHNAYRFASGYWNSGTFYDDGKVPARFVADLTIGYVISPYGLSLRAHVMNLLDNRTVDVLGAPTPRRLFYLQLGYAYQGLNL